MEVANPNRNIFNISIQFLCIGVLLLLQCKVTFAQLRLVPLEEGYYEQEISTENVLRTGVVSLPFFDDFSTTKTAAPDSRYWLPGSGVYVNNTLSTTQPSRNIATFDGLSVNGVPYNLVNPLGQGYTDTLTSQPINLSGKSVSDSVYLSFYWMAKGLGELPDSSDFLSVEFLNRNNEWTNVWNQNGFEADTLFTQKFIKISDPLYFHGAFQFRFRSYGRGSGPYDTWHLDYVYLDTKRSVRQPFIFDVATRKPISPFLKTYSAMPLRQYLVRPASMISDSVNTDIVNHFNNFNILTSTFTLTDERSGKEYQRNVQRSIYVESLKSKPLGVKLTAPAIASTADSINLVSRFFLTTTDSIPNLSLKNNDTIVSRVTLKDYFAFDDGSAEYGVQVNQKLGRVATRYVLTKPDTIGGVRLALVPFNKDIAGQSFTVQFYSNKNGKPDQIIAQRSVPVSYPAKRDGFVDYKLASPVAVSDTFYVGWTQINEQPVTVGFDRNSRLGKSHIFYNLGTEWIQEKGLNGSIMIRPYLGEKAQGVITGNEEVINENVFFPNPNRGKLHWKNENLKQIEIFSKEGVLTKTFSTIPGRTSQDISQLPDGLYLLRASDGKRSFAQKLLIFK
ncbi:T9SS type A sorting domain-containing protein [Dyadobacter aurulentus]|uniref:T9SS type A sorting domain-containing protein n=1 Tax=Dyadobacter sp. UC 10 TaxID=2605428 RepID=UPI0011F20710|nr:T9SS type A sorting domain-containing protein [Dyadobacter sp. UC 10]KAA0991468.1 T9SS type A sorting domain-containing protein [Dyadobacter sp. UC 10]